MSSEAAKRVVQLEPRIQQLANAIAQFKQESKSCDTVCANAFWYGRIKPQLEDCIGWSRNFPGCDELEPDAPEGLIDFTDLVKMYVPMEEARAKYMATLSEPDKWLFSPAAYDAAYEFLYELLPDCKNCNCW